MKKKPTYEELEKRVKTLQSLLNAFTETAILIDVEGVILTINETAAQRLGKTVEEMVGTELVELLSPGPDFLQEGVGGGGGSHREAGSFPGRTCRQDL